MTLIELKIQSNSCKTLKNFCDFIDDVESTLDDLEFQELWDFMVDDHECSVCKKPNDRYRAAQGITVCETCFWEN